MAHLAGAENGKRKGRGYKVCSDGQAWGFGDGFGSRFVCERRGREEREMVCLRGTGNLGRCFRVS
jgi:hypothetical protein